jgi:hypothetical protein
MIFSRTDYFSLFVLVEGHRVRQLFFFEACDTGTTRTGLFYACGEEPIRGFRAIAYQWWLTPACSTHIQWKNGEHANRRCPYLTLCQLLPLAWQYVPHL